MKTPQEYEACAEALFLEGYNCSQSVVAAFSDILGVDRRVAVRMASSFGGGMGRMREVCGCVSGMFMILGYLYGYDDPKVYDGKKALYEKVQELAARFKEEQGSIYCKVLLKAEGKDASPVPEMRTEAYYKRRPCPRLAGFSARILAEYIQDHPCE